MNRRRSLLRRIEALEARVEELSGESPVQDPAGYWELVQALPRRATHDQAEEAKAEASLCRRCRRAVRTINSGRPHVICLVVPDATICPDRQANRFLPAFPRLPNAAISGRWGSLARSRRGRCRSSDPKGFIAVGRAGGPHSTRHLFRSRNRRWQCSTALIRSSVVAPEGCFSAARAFAICAPVWETLRFAIDPCTKGSSIGIGSTLGKGVSIAGLGMVFSWSWWWLVATGAPFALTVLSATGALVGITAVVAWLLRK